MCFSIRLLSASLEPKGEFTDSILETIGSVGRTSIRKLFSIFGLVRNDTSYTLIG